MTGLTPNVRERIRELDEECNKLASELADIAKERTRLHDERDDAHARIRELEAVVKRIPNIASYVVATLDSAARSDEEWGKVHRGRAGSSIRQLKSLGDQAAEAINEEAPDVP